MEVIRSCRKEGSFGAAFVNQVPHPQSKRRRDGNLYFARGIYLDHKYSVTGARDELVLTMPGFQMRASVLCHAEARTPFFFTLASLNGILDILLADPVRTSKSRDSSLNSAVRPLGFLLPISTATFTSDDRLVRIVEWCYFF